MSKSVSVRAQVLRKALGYLNQGKYEDLGEQLWFGGGFGGCPPDELLDEREKFYSDLAKEVEEYTSALTSSQRTTLGHVPEMSERLLDFVDRLREQRTKAGIPAAEHSEQKMTDH